MRWIFGPTSALLAALVALSVLAACGDDGGTAETIDSRDDTTAAPPGDPEDGEAEGEGQGQGQGQDNDEGDDDQDDGDDGRRDDDDQGDGGEGVSLTSSGDHDCTDGQDVQVGGTDL